MAKVSEWFNECNVTVYYVELGSASIVDSLISVIVLWFVLKIMNQQ